jgi:hypothetical protein
LASVSCPHHFGGADELEAWEAHSMAAGHRQDCTSIEAGPEGHDGVDVAQNRKHSLPGLWPGRSTEEIGGGETMDMCEPDVAVDGDQRAIAFGFLSEF